MQSKILRIVNNVVINVEIVSNEWLLNYSGDDLLMIVDETNSHVGIDWTYIPEIGFHSPQPYPSWKLDGLIWKAPKQKPNNDSRWDESILDWVEIETTFI